MARRDLGVVTRDALVGELEGVARRAPDRQEIEQRHVRTVAENQVERTGCAIQRPAAALAEGRSSSGLAMAARAEHQQGPRTTEPALQASFNTERRSRERQLRSSDPVIAIGSGLNCAHC
jgi:hypothetical protein